MVRLPRNSAASTISQIVWPRCKHASCTRAVSAGRDTDAIWPDSSRLPAAAPVSATVIIPAHRGGLERPDHIDRVARCAEPYDDIPGPPDSQHLAGKHLVIGVVIADRRHRGCCVRKADGGKSGTVEREPAHELSGQMPGVLR